MNQCPIPCKFTKLPTFPILHEIMSQGKQPRKVQARSLFCFWAVSELGMSIRQVARRLEMSPPGVGFSVERGEAIAHENEYHLID